MAIVLGSADSSTVSEVFDRIFDKGIVIDAWTKVGVELPALEAHIVVASVETCLTYADSIGIATA